MQDSNQFTSGVEPDVIRRTTESNPSQVQKSSNETEKMKFDRVTNKNKNSKHALTRMTSVLVQTESAWEWKMKCVDCNKLLTLKNPLNSAERHWGGKHCAVKAQSMKRSRDDLEEHTKRVKYISETPDDWSNLTPEQSKFMAEALNF
jgi:hypothetical protein